MADTDTADQVSADDWAAAMGEQATAEAKASRPTSSSRSAKAPRPPRCRIST
jgi:hypothetical protein